MSKERYYTYKLDMVLLNILAIILFVIVCFFVLLIEHNDSYVITSDINLFIYMVLWLMLHEVLHGIGFGIFKNVSISNITFGMALEKGVFYCMCKQAIDKKVILTSLLFPVTIIGLITLIIGMIVNSYVLVLLSILNFTGSIGDIVMIIYFLKVGRVRYLDLDDCTSFTVLSREDLTNVGCLGIKLVNSGIYDDSKIYPRDKKKLTITNLSYILLVVILIIFIIDLIGGI